MPLMVEEWWGRTFEGRGRFTIDNMPDFAPETLMRTVTVTLLQVISSEPTSARGLACQMELRRRENWTGRAALIVSVLALIVAAAAAIAA